ncbi:MAG: helix-turn-helix domain-containing protein [Fimbriimonadaceae bacterium]|nr:helix-turn-helix domain-containing protein [Fimbriimonadaceae bacterium]
MTATEAAEYLRIGRTKIYGLLESKAIRCKRIGKSIRILRSDLEKFLEKG